MNKTLLTLFNCAVFVAVALATPGHAFMRKDMSLVRGKIVSADEVQRFIVVHGYDGEGEVRFDVASAVIEAPLQNGLDVIVIYKKEGNIATLVRPAPQR